MVGGMAALVGVVKWVWISGAVRVSMPLRQTWDFLGVDC